MTPEAPSPADGPPSPGTETKHSAGLERAEALRLVQRCVHEWAAKYAALPADADYRCDTAWPDDPRVGLVYELLCDTLEPPGDRHWEGWVAEIVVAALFPAENSASSPSEASVGKETRDEP